MVSNARLDLPEPESPVITISASRGSSRSTPLRLCARAPEITIRSDGITFAAASPPYQLDTSLNAPRRTYFDSTGANGRSRDAQAGSGDAWSRGRPRYAASHESVAASTAAANPREA